MELATVGSKYQIVIPKNIWNKMKIQPGDKVGLFLDDSGILKIKLRSKSWVERTYGMMKEAWKGIDPIAELKKMRDEWEERLREIEKIKQTKRV